MMAAMRITWVDAGGPPGRIAQTHRPRPGLALEQDLAAVRAAGADVLVSCLTDADVERLGLEDEPAAAARVGLEFRRFPIVDHALPESVEATVAFADELAGDLAAGRSVVTHCFAGIGRSGLILVATLVRGGLPLTEAVARASRARGLPVPETAAQRRWLEQVEPRP